MRFGAIGWGLRRPIGLEAHRPEEGREVVALADPREERWSVFRDDVGSDAKCFADYRYLLGLDLDAILVLSPDYLHEEHAVACLGAGIPVFLEKPMATTIEGCDRILEASERTGTKLYLGHNMRHSPIVRLMKRWIDEGRIGKVQTAWCRHFISYGGEAFFKDWHAERAKTTGLLVQKASHDIDVLHWLCGGFTLRVTAMGRLMVYGDVPHRRASGPSEDVTFNKIWPPRSLQGLNPVIEVEDVSMMLMELDNGVLCNYSQCHFTPDAWRNYTIIGDEGRIENFGDTPGSTVKLWNHGFYGFDPQADLEETIPTLEGTHGGSDPAIMAGFVRFLSDGGKTDTSPVAGRMAVAAGVCATESLRDGSRPIDVPGI